MILHEKQLLGYAQTILRITGRQEHSKTMDNKLSVYCRIERPELVLARWSNPDDAVRIKQYDKSYRDWSVMAVAQDIVENVRSAGFDLEVVWDA